MTPELLRTDIDDAREGTPNRRYIHATYHELHILLGLPNGLDALARPPRHSDDGKTTTEWVLRDAEDPMNGPWTVYDWKATIASGDPSLPTVALLRAQHEPYLWHVGGGRNTDTFVSWLKDQLGELRRRERASRGMR